MATSIAIVGSEVRTDPKRYVAYQIALTGFNRSWTIWRRYSGKTKWQQIFFIVGTEFEALHNTFLKLFPHAPPPVPLPPKLFSLFGYSTASDPLKVDDRRKGLEDYLSGILHARDDRWRKSNEWNTFLGIEGFGLTGPQLGDGRRTMTPEEWMDELRSIYSACRDVRGMAANRERFMSSGDIAASQFSVVQAKKMLAEIDGQIEILTVALQSHESARAEAASQSSGSSSAAGILSPLMATVVGAKDTFSKSSALSSAELARRSDLLQSLKDERDRVYKVVTTSNTSSDFRSSTSTASSNPGGAGSQRLGVSPGGALTPASSPGGARGSGRKFGKTLPQETEATIGLDNPELVQLQQRVITDQDQALETLSTIVKRQYQIGVAIGNELEVQNHLLENLDDAVDKSAGNLKGARKKLDYVSKGR
ncbi:hypothetical protein HDU76_007062 [Blyttiomyces sp. JEL0837]|nr:hypothetical protein HDU76_007062 [Blyttiomyces sp. JEL0837]